MLIGLLHIYQSWSATRSPACRFTPSCSQYAVEAVARFGPWRGLGLAVRRLGRCRPGGPFGYDPVPGTAGPSPSEESTP